MDVNLYRAHGPRISTTGKQEFARRKINRRAYRRDAHMHDGRKNTTLLCTFSQ